MFSDTIRAKLSGRTVILRRFVEMQFLSETFRGWDGPGLLQAGGASWLGFGDLVSITDLQEPMGGLAQTLTVGVSGVPADLFAKAVNAAVEVKNRPLIVSLGVYDPDSLTLVDSLAVVWRGVMDKVEGKLSGATAAVSVTAETAFARRAIAPYGYLSDVDQQHRLAGDRGLELLSTMVNRSIEWPPP